MLQSKQTGALLKELMINCKKSYVYKRDGNKIGNVMRTPLKCDLSQDPGLLLGFLYQSLVEFVVIFYLYCRDWNFNLKFTILPIFRSPKRVKIKILGVQYWCRFTLIILISKPE